MHDPRVEEFTQTYGVYAANSFGRVPTLSELDPNNWCPPIDPQKVYSRRNPLQMPIDPDTMTRALSQRSSSSTLNENGLIYDTTLTLNRSATKKIVVGINPRTQFKREIRIYTDPEDFIILTLEEVYSLTKLNFDMQWDLQVLNQTTRIYRNPWNNICTVVLDMVHKMRMGLPTINGIKDNFYIISGLYNKLSELEGDIASTKILTLCRDIGTEFKFIVPPISKVKELFFKSYIIDCDGNSDQLISSLLLKFPNFFISLLTWNWEQNCCNLEHYEEGVKLFYRDDYC